MDTPETVDVIVIGAGTAGSVVARRLHDGGLGVLLLEAGPDAGRADIDDPARMHELWHSDVDWDYYTVEQEHAHRRRLHLPRGRVVGGSHALNAMVWARGHAADYDTWAYLGSPSWSWADVEPYFRRIEDGPLDLLTDYEPAAIHRDIAAAAVEHGIPLNPDYNSGRPDGVSFAHLTIRDGRRSTTARAYLGPIRGRPGLTVAGDAVVHRVLMAGSRCTGVEWRHAGQPRRTSAGHVVLAAGALGSPLVLQRSGIGDPDHLRPLGVEVTAALRGVGRNLQDHWLVPVVFSTMKEVPRPPGLPSCHSHLFWRSRPGLAVPDLQPIHFASPLVAPWMTEPEHGITLMAGLVRPASRGSVRIGGPGPEAAPVIDPRVLSAPEDLDALLAAVELCRAIGRRPALRDGWGARELYPASLSGSVERAHDYIRETVVTYHHQAGTCAMGRGEDAVVGPDLRVHGVDGLTVADASIMPLVTTGNTNAPTAMIAERAADFLLG